MIAAKFLLPALSVASTAYAASCSASSATTITNPAGASAIAACTTYTGNIVVQSGAANAQSLFSFGSLKKIDGDFTYENDKEVSTLSGTSLSTITGALTLNNMSALSSTGLGSLKSVGSMTLEGLAILNDLGLVALEEAGMVTIQNTNINSLGVLQNITSLSGLSVSNNAHLQTISLAVSEVGIISVGPNDANGQSASFKNLETAASLFIRNCTGVELPALSNLTGSLELLGNTFKSFAADKLTSAGGIVINDNTALLNVSFPELKGIDSHNATLQIANNTKLFTISGFPLLKNVSGDVTFSGNFSKVTLDKIDFIGGALVVDTASSDFDCSGISSLKKEVVQGKETCKIGDKKKIGGSSGGTSTSGGSGSSASSSGVGTPMDIPASFMSGFAVLTGILSLFM